ncbi:MAG TPA: hypothetical protein VIJ16_04860 [Gemmatimonadaceae bacterium]
MANLRSISLLVLAVASPVAAQSNAGMQGMPGMQPVAVSATAAKQIDSVARSVRPLNNTNAASAAGFHPVFGWIPTMGTHWVDMALMAKDKQQCIGMPSNLMFSKIAGRDSLLGAAFAYFTLEGDSTPPVLFDGAPPWHEHPNLAPPGQRLVMLHVWFVPSPDGPFAGTNPNIPFWAAGLAAPDSARMRDAAFSAMVRRAALALAEVVDTTAIFANLEMRPDVHAVLAVRRDSIRALIPQFQAAEREKNQAQWERVAERAAAQWDAIYAAYDHTARTRLGKQRVDAYVAMLLGHHEM